jgi:hypothetical protein
MSILKESDLQTGHSKRVVKKDQSIVELAWRILQQGDTVLLLSLICLMAGNKEIGWPDPAAKTKSGRRAVDSRRAKGR